MPTRIEDTFRRLGGQDERNLLIVMAAAMKKLGERVMVFTAQDFNEALRTPIAVMHHPNGSIEFYIETEPSGDLFPPRATTDLEQPCGCTWDDETNERIYCLAHVRADDAI